MPYTSPRQRAILVYVAEHPGCTRKEAMTGTYDGTQASSTSAYEAIKRLERRGLLEDRSRVGLDGREVKRGAALYVAGPLAR